MSRSLVLLPTYNERENIPRVLPRLHAIEQDLDIIVIDDASPDGTGILAEALVSDYPRLSVLHRAQKDGLGRAYVEGMKEALRRGYSRIVTMDADLSHAPEDVPRLLSALDDAEVAVGSRHVPGGGVEGWPPVRRLLSRAGSIYARVALGIPASDTTSGFRAYRAEALRAIDLESIRARGFVFQVEILRRILDLPGARVREVPICFRNRLHGRSKLTLGIIGEAATEVLRLRSRKVLPPNVVRNHAPQEDNQAPLVSVIVPLRLGAPEPRAIEALASISYPRDRLEVIIVRGECPARQRNLAARQARGDLLLFLDDDSVPSRGLFKAYREAFSREPELAAAGGPAVYTASGFGERLCAAVLSEPLVTGRSASRYSVRGASRLTDELELILANLAVRRSSFEAAGGFEEALYPNEENLFLDRLRQRGEKARYEPAAAVTRPAPRAGPEVLGKVFRYGRGRAAQARRRFSSSSAWRVSAALAALLCVSLGIAALPWTWIPLLILGTFLVPYHSALLVRVSLREGLRLGIAAPIAASGIQIAYAAGVISGLLRRFPAPVGQVTLEKRTLGVGRSPRTCWSLHERSSAYVQDVQDEDDRP